MQKLLIERFQNRPRARHTTIGIGVLDCIARAPIEIRPSNFNLSLLFAKTGKVTGVTVDLGEQKYKLEIDRGRLAASVAMVVRGITLSTKTMDPAEWFAILTAETQKASAHAQALSQSLSAFMGT